MYGQNNPAARLTDNDVKIIIKELKRGELNTVELGRLFNVDRRTIARIRSLDSWTHMTVNTPEGKVA